MKIGILTYHAVCNFGANLQALSTLYYLRNHGYEVEFINWFPDDLEQYYKRNTPQIQYAEHEDFRTTYFPMSKRCYSDDDIATVIREDGIEAIIVGSDAVMKTRPLRSRYTFPTREFISVYHPTEDQICPNPFWGSYYHLLDKKIPLCYMSASSQNSPYRKSNRKEKEIQKKMLLQYNYISTRDDWTAEQVRWLTDGEISPIVTPDPVFAFNYNVKYQPSKKEIIEKFGLNDNYCLFSFHSDKPVTMNWLKEMEQRMNNRGVQCVAFPFPQGVEFHHPFLKQINLPLSPLDWYCLIKYATYYVGDNMHPIVICLHNSVPCFSFDQYGIVKWRFFVDEKSSKIFHILNEFGHAQNRISLRGSYSMPLVQYVLEKLDCFDKEHVKIIAGNYLEAYKKMMLDIENVINLFTSTL